MKYYVVSMLPIYHHYFSNYAQIVSAAMVFFLYLEILFRLFLLTFLCRPTPLPSMTSWGQRKTEC
jgi:hypothetical protein